MRYAEESLSRGEHIVYEGALHWKVLVVPTLAGLVLLSLAVSALQASSSTVSLLLFMCGIGIIVLRVLSWRSAEITLTNRRVVKKMGVLILANYF